MYMHFAEQLNGLLMAAMLPPRYRAEFANWRRLRAARKSEAQAEATIAKLTAARRYDIGALDRRETGLAAFVSTHPACIAADPFSNLGH